MAYGVVELWKPKPSWHALSSEEKQGYINQLPKMLEQLMSAGVKLHGMYWSRYGSDYQFFASWEMPNQEMVEALARGLEEASWYRYFDQVAYTGKAVTLEEFLNFPTHK
jgi:hypothetical protein